MQAVRLNDTQYAELRRFADARWGLKLTPRHRTLVDGRLTKLLRKSAIRDVDEIVRGIRSGQTSTAFELALFDALSTNLTRFFRESGHFDFLAKDLLRPLEKDPSLRPDRRLRFWSAGCSCGCEPYSLSMTLHEEMTLSNWDVRILATDFAVSEIERARRGVYSGAFLDDVDPARRKRFFADRTQNGVASLRVNQEVKNLVTFGIVNLKEPWKMRGPFDAIFCRNVMIYFDEALRRELVQRFVGLLRPNGILFIGSSESISGQSFEPIQACPSAYRKRAGSTASSAVA